jgi:hypothetical protein
VSAAADFDWPTLRDAFRRDGVVRLGGALDADQLGATLDAYDWSLAHPGPGASKDRHTASVTFYNDLFNPGAPAAYRAMLQASPIPQYVAELWRTPQVWFFYEQVFLKEGGEVRRTPWHQDSSYLAIAGEDLAVVWISFDRLAQADSLEFVRGSHRGVLYNGSSFKPGDDTAPLHPGSRLPRLPDIEADRSGWDIVSWAVEPGDLIVFHPQTLHGGAATHAGMRRRTLTLRFFGEQAVYDARDGGAGPPIKGFHERMRPGDPFRDPAFLKLS